MNKGLSIVGSSRANGDREENDFYPTPRYAVEALLEREKFEGSFWEPACGEGDISEVIKKYYPNNSIRSTDLIDRGYGQGDINFLSQIDLAGMGNIDNIITNPPFSMALEFVEQSKKYSNKKIAMFLKTVFLEGKSRYNMFNDKKFPLKCMYQFAGRVPIYKSGIKLRNSGLIAYAWFVWIKGYEGDTIIKWIN